MYADSFAPPLVLADNACTVVRERPTLNVTPQGGRSATDPGPSTTGSGLFEAGVPKPGDMNAGDGAGAGEGGRDDSAGSGAGPGGDQDAVSEDATAEGEQS